MKLPGDRPSGWRLGVLIGVAPAVFIVMLFRGSVGHAAGTAGVTLAVEAALALVTDGFHRPH